MKALTKIVVTVRQPFVFAVNSAYGSGKTTFIRMWRQHLKNQGFQTLHFNAWENDFTENALVSILGEFRQAVNEVKGETKSRFLQHSLKLARGLGKHAVPVMTRVTVSAIPGGEKVVEEIGKLAEKVAEERLQDYEKDKATIHGFRKELAGFVKKISPDKPVLFFIDELDRCRPLFAIEVLEHSKHILNIPGLVFVLAIAVLDIFQFCRALFNF